MVWYLKVCFSSFLFIAILISLLKFVTLMWCCRPMRLWIYTMVELGHDQPDALGIHSSSSFHTRTHRQRHIPSRVSVAGAKRDDRWRIQCWTKCLDWSILYAASACVVHLKRNAANAQSARLLLNLDSRIATCEREKRNDEKSDGVMFVSPWNSKL